MKFPHQKVRGKSAPWLINISTTKKNREIIIARYAGELKYNCNSIHD